AEQVARQLDIPLTLVKVDAQDLAPVLMDLVWKLDLPFGDPVTGPQYLLGRAARAEGLTAVFNGEGRGQPLGRSPPQPMISALRRPLRGRQPRGDLSALLPPLLRPRGTTLHARVSASDRRDGTAPRPAAALPGERRRLHVPQSRAACRHLAQGLAKHPAAHG